MSYVILRVFPDFLIIMRLANKQNQSSSTFLHDAL